VSENLDLVRSIVADWEHGDYGSADWAHPDIDFVIADGPTPGRWRGLEGMAEGWRSFLSAWEEFHGVGEHYQELDEERVLVLSTFGGRGSGSGLDLSRMPIRVATLLHLRNAKVTRMVTWFDRDRALADLGLEQ
jgi:hypothetical protein